jgi:hypothetical protein
MSVLVRLYPSAWRERYGDELEAVLKDRAPGPFDVADPVLGALDAHLHVLLAPVWLILGGTAFGLGWIGLGIDGIRGDRRSGQPILPPDGTAANAVGRQ